MLNHVGSDQQKNKYLAEITRLRRFTGAPAEFWPAFLSAAGGIAGAARAILILKDAASSQWKKLGEWTESNQTDHSVDVVLFVFGCVSVVGIWLVGLFVDRRLLLLAIVSCSLFIAAMAILGLLPELRSGVYLAVGIWGLAFGGAATIFQTAMARAAPQQTDVAQSMLVTAWNLAIAGGGILGGTMLTQFGSAAFAPAVTALLMACLAVIAIRRNAFQHSF